jgi:DNA-directed RNA polymerase specialized sigma24 family protein
MSSNNTEKFIEEIKKLSDDEQMAFSLLKHSKLTESEIAAVKNISVEEARKLLEGASSLYSKYIK